MNTVQAIEQAIQRLPEPDLVELRQWFAEFNETLWDRQIERDAKAGKLDALAAEALADYHSGQATEF